MLQAPSWHVLLLLPTLLKTSETDPARVAWAASIVVDAQIPTGGVTMEELASTSPDQQANYARSKLGNWLLAAALAHEVGGENTGRLLSVAYNPGNLKTNLTRHMPLWMPLLVSPLLYHARYGAYTTLWAGLSPDLRLEHGGSYIVPWGRLHPGPRADLVPATRSPADGGTGLALQFKEFCDKTTLPYQ